MIHYHEPIPAEQPKIDPPALGTWAVVSSVCEKIHEPESDICTQWQRRKINDTRMMFIGIRKVREGGMKEVYGEVWDDDGCPMTVHLSNAFQPTRFLTVWLFVKDAYSKPVHCLPGDAAIIPF